MKVSLITILLCAYFGIDAFLINLVYSNYATASNALPIIAKREFSTTMLAALLLKGIVDQDLTDLCASDSDSIEFVQFTNLALDIEKRVLDYKKSSDSIFTDFSNILYMFDSGGFCNFETGSAYTLCRTIDNGILLNGLRNFVFYLVQTLGDARLSICQNTSLAIGDLDPALEATVMTARIIL